MGAFQLVLAQQSQELTFSRRSSPSVSATCNVGGSDPGDRHVLPMQTYAVGRSTTPVFKAAAGGGTVSRPIMRMMLSGWA